MFMSSRPVRQLRQVLIEAVQIDSLIRNHEIGQFAWLHFIKDRYDWLSQEVGTSQFEIHPPAVERIFGSEQEFDKKPISRGFSENHEFGLGDGHALSLEQQVAQILVASSSSHQGLDIAVDRFHNPETYLDAAVV
jgi:hypothetical protein